MKRALVLTALLAIAAVGGALAYRAAVRDRSYRVLIASGEAALTAGDTLAAVEDFSGAIAVRSDAMLARLRRGETYYRRGDLDLAARDFRAASALDPTAIRPLEALADVLFAQGRYRRAVETYLQRLALDDRSAAVRYKLALARFREGTVAEALADARRALALDDDLAAAHYLTALCLRDQGQLDQAITALETAVSKAPGLIAAREELADLLAASGRAPDQLEQLQVLAGLDSQHTERQVAIGLAQATSGKTDLAVATLSAALDRASDPAVVHEAIGRVWLQIAGDGKDRPDAVGKALEALERAASSLTATSETKALYGRALALSGQLEAAEQVFQQAAQRFPVDPLALHQLGLVAEQLGHADTARAVQHHALAQRMRRDTQLRPIADRVQVAMRRALSLALEDGRLAHGDVILPGPVVVRVVPYPHLPRGGDDGGEQRVTVIRIGHPDRPAPAAIGVVAAALVALHLLEHRQHVGVAPAAVTQLGPHVIVLRLATHEGIAVDGGRPAQQLAARHMQLPPVRARLGFRLIQPVRRRIVQQLAATHGDRAPRIAWRARLQQQHPVGRILAQTMRHRRASRSRADNDVVVGIHRVFVPSPIWRPTACRVDNWSNPVHRP